MLTRSLGAGAVSVSRVIHGCMGFADDAALATRTIHAAFAAGVTAFDTAPLYGFGRSEELLGAALADRRGDVQILTKVGLRWDDTFGRVLFEATDGAGARRVVRRDARPASVRAQVEQSLRRLRVETIDLLQVHQRDEDTPIAQTMATLEQLQREGKIRAIGVSNFSVGDCREAVARLGVPLAATQVEYNLVERRIESELLPWARAANVAVLAYSPFAQGVLAGRQLGAAALPADWRRGSVAFSPENVALLNRALESSALPIARARGASVAEVALAWLLAQPGVTAVIVGSSTPEQATANARAAELRLTADELARLTSTWRGLALVRPSGRSLVGKARALLSRLGKS